MINRLYIFSRLLFFCLLLVLACEEPVDPVPPLPPPPLPPATSYAYFNLSATPWPQDSLKNVYVSFSEIKLNGANGVTFTAAIDSTRLYNLLELDETPVFLGSDSVQSGGYSTYSIKMRSFVLKKKSKEHGHEQSGGGNYKVQLCHYPPGNPANNKTLEIGACAVASHLKHGDTPGRCGESGYTAGSKLFNHIEYNDGTIVPLFVLKDLTLTDSLEIFIPDGEEVDVMINIDVAKSIVPFVSDNDDDDDDDHDGDGDPDDYRCDNGYVFIFKPQFEVSVIVRKGHIAGVYAGTLTAGRTYSVFLYGAGTYSKTEENVNNPFPNAIASTNLTATRTFRFQDVRVGTYDIILAEYRNGRFSRYVSRENNVVVISSETVTPTIPR